MSCADFKNLLFEYLDGTLPPDSKKACEQHLAQCEPCREEWARHRTLAEEISERFERQTEGLALASAARARILEECERGSIVEEFTGFWRRSSWRWGIAGLCVLALTLIGIRAVKEDSVASKDTVIPTTIFVRIPQTIPTYTFHKEGRYVIDSMTYRTNLVQETLWANYRRDSSAQNPANPL
jgi:anti-sigma factor RsiW